MRRSLPALSRCLLLAAGAAAVVPASVLTQNISATASVASRESAVTMFRVNQVGYPTNLPKRALAMVRHASSSRFSVLDSHGRIVEHHTATVTGSWNGHYLVYSLDFSRVSKPGLYTFRFAGTRSPPVRIGSASALYRPLADAALAFLQSQRDGPETIQGTMRRKAAHRSDTSASVYRLPRYRATTLLGGLAPTGERVDVSGGWFDAGDYLKFVETASFADVALLYAAREYPNAFSDPAALLAEARHGTDWLLKMWDQSRRVLYFQVGIGDGNGAGILGDHDLWRLPQADESSDAKPGSPTWFAVRRPVFAASAPGRPISPNLAGRVAASFGLCAQVFAASDPAYAARCLLAGQTIYDQANTRPGVSLLTSVPHVYYDESEWRDDMALGAAELYLATQRLSSSPAVRAQGPLPHTDLGYYLARAGQWINAYIEGALSGEDSFNLYDVSTLAGRDIAKILGTPVGQSLQRANFTPTDPTSLLADRADQLRLAVRLARKEPFGLANPSTNLDTVAHALGYAIEANVYDQLAGTSVFAPFAQSQVGWVLGANAWGTSFVVGAGSVFPHCLASQIPNLAGSLNGRGAILRGATVNGPTAPANLHELGAPEGFRPCPGRVSADPFRGQVGHGLAYLDDVRSPATSEPTDDLAALTLLASAQLASGG